MENNLLILTTDCPSCLYKFINNMNDMSTDSWDVLMLLVV